MDETRKCNHCGVFVPAEKAFCPNCSEPMEEEESSNRADSFNSEMMATIRDDPEQYKHLLKQPVQQKPASAQAEPPAPSAQSFTPSPPPATPPPIVEQPAVAGYGMPQTGYAPADGAKSTGRRYLAFGLIALTLLLLVFIILVAFKVINIGLFS